MNYYVDAWRDYFNFSGRARRKEYWYFVLFHALVLLSGDLLFASFYNEDPAIGNALGVALALYFLLSIIPGIAVTVRRLHDIGKSGWWYFVGAIPVIGAIWMLILTCTDGVAGPNQYGPDPKALEAAA
jgi:uncharacterized membrane protein YhaH (DUF805 family)